MNIRIIPAALACALALGSAPGRAQGEAPQTNKIAVLDISAGKDVDPALTAALTELTMVKAQAFGYGECIGTSDIKALLNLEEQKQLLNCSDDAACVAEIGGALGVSRLMTGSVSRLGSKYFVTLKLFDVHKARVLARVASQIEAEDDKLLSQYPDLVLQLFAPRAEGGGGTDDGSTISTAQPGTLEIRSEPPGSTVTLDGAAVGSTPLELTDVRPGTHAITIAYRDYETYQAQITVVPAQRNLVSVELKMQTSLAQRNYEVLLEKNKKERVAQQLWGVANTCLGSIVLIAGGVVTASGVAARNAWVWVPGLFVTAGGIGWTATGVLQLLNLPEPPEPPAEQDESAGDKD